MNALAALVQLVRVVGLCLRGGAGDVTDGVPTLEPGHHVGEAVFERLVRGQGPAERVTVEGPLDGHVEGRLHAPDRLGVENRERNPHQPLDLG